MLENYYYTSTNTVSMDGMGIAEVVEDWTAGQEVPGSRCTAFGYVSAK